jgi:F0F1-type ATP synthase epsilon subunit
MADMMQFDLVSPERRLASLEVSEVRVPGADGDMTAMADHAPTITTLRPGMPAAPTTISSWVASPIFLRRASPFWPNGRCRSVN